MNKVTIETLAARVAALEAANDMQLEASIWRKEMEGRFVKPRTVEAPAGVEDSYTDAEVLMAVETFVGAADSLLKAAQETPEKAEKYVQAARGLMRWIAEGAEKRAAKTQEASSVPGDPAQLYDISIDGETYSLTTESEPIHYQGKTYFAFRKGERSNPTGSL